MSESSTALGHDHSAAVELRAKTQEHEKEARDQAREAAHFITDKWGQWEQTVWDRFSDRPKYQIDLTKPVIDRIAGEIEQMEFGGTVIPSSGEAEEEISETYEGMLRTIDNMSNAQQIYQDAARKIIGPGYDAWLITTDWADADAFEQDILIRKIPNAIDRVWIPGVAEASKLTDLKSGFVDTYLSLKEYKRQFPEGSAMSVGEAASTTYYSGSPNDGIYVSDFYYIKETSKTLHLLSDGTVIDDEDFQKASSALAGQGVSIVRSRKRKIPKCYMRKLDANDWLTDEKETPFSYIPIVECYGNFDVLEKKAVYYGEIKKLMDPQRIYNYSTSREIADGALAPVDKIAATVEQVRGHEDQNRELNTANDALFLYNADTSGAPPPYRMGGPSPNPQLLNTANRAQQDIKEISMSHNPMQGQGISGHSGKAYEILTQNADSASHKYIKALKKSVQQTYDIIIDAIPRVYDTVDRQVSLTQPDGTTQFAPINKQIFDELGNPAGSVNDLSQGRYTFKVMAGPAYTSRQSELVDVISKWAAIDPTIISEGGDILFGAMQQPGMEQIAERKRKSLLDSGMIPESQLTNKEREKIAQQIQMQQEQEQSNPIDQATISAILAQVQDTMSQIEERQSRVQIAFMEENRKMMETLAKIQKGEIDMQKTQSETLGNLRQATGADAIINPSVIAAYDDIAQDMAEGDDLPDRVN